MRIEDYGLIGDMAAACRSTWRRALGFRDFLLRVGTGDLTAIQIMYGIGGERRLTEFERQRQVGNFPQASSQLTLIGAATAIAAADAA